jgi:hypothetical protein
MLAFGVIRKGDDIGGHTLRFAKSGDALTVTTRTDIAVKAPFIGVTPCQFVQDSTEVWTGGKLTSPRIVANDDGHESQISVGASDLVTASLWNRDITGAGAILNTIHGMPTAIAAARLGEEMAPAGGKRVPAAHYKITREVWYDVTGALAKAALTGDDGSAVDYVLT